MRRRTSHRDSACCNPPDGRLAAWKLQTRMGAGDDSETIETTGLSSRSGNSRPQNCSPPAGATLMKKLSVGISPLLVFVLIACGGGAGEVSTPVSLSRLTIEADKVPQRVGTTQQLTAIATFSDHRTRDVTSCTTWTSDENHVVTISGGRETALKPGKATVFATFRAFGKTATASISMQVIAAASRPKTIESAILQRELFMNSQYGADRMLTERTMRAGRKRTSSLKSARHLNTNAERVGWLETCTSRQKPNPSGPTTRGPKSDPPRPESGNMGK